MHIFDFRWDQDKETPYFECIDDGKLKKKYLIFNDNIFLTLRSNITKCIGAKINGEYQPCPQQVIGQKKCEVCKKREDYFPCQYCNGFNCNRFRDKKIENCDADHMVYLALFDKDLVKVGVSRISRGKARQFEQGSNFTRILARGMTGIMARRIETTLIRSGFPDKIPSTRKKNILFTDISKKEGKKILENKYNIAKDQIISIMPEMQKFIPSIEIFWDMREYYKNFSEEVLEKFSLPIHILSLEENESVGGKLVMIKGSFLVINTGRELAIILAKDFIGKEISFDKCEKGITKNGGFQGGLF